MGSCAEPAAAGVEDATPAAAPVEAEAGTAALSEETAFDDGRIDLAFSRPLPPERAPAFHQETVYCDRLAIALPVGHPLAGQKLVPLKKLAAESFVQFHRQGAPGLYDEVLATCRRAGFSPRVISEPNFMATVMTLVA